MAPPKRLPPVAFEVILAAAERGDAAAQHHLGMRYYSASGGGVETQDVEAAVKWWAKAALQGHPVAAYNLVGVISPLFSST